MPLYERRKPSPEPELPQLPPAVSEVMRAEFEEKEFGVVGEWVVGTPGPTTVLPPPIVFDPPDWDLEERERLERERLAELEAAKKLVAEEAALDEEQPAPHPPITREPA
jgi:hypothetical protein